MYVAHEGDSRLDFNLRNVERNGCMLNLGNNHTRTPIPCNATGSHCHLLFLGIVDLMLGDLLGQRVSGCEHRKPSLKKTER
jgi:hypothetical protein